MDLSFRRVAGRFVMAAGVSAAAILVFRGDQTSPGVTYVIDPRPLGRDLRHMEVTLTVGDDITAMQTGDWDRDRPITPLRLTTPTPAGPVTITLDVLTVDGAHRVVHQAEPGDGATVRITIGAAATP